MKLKLFSDNDEPIQDVDIYSKEGFELISELWLKTSAHHRLMYEPTWLGIPIIQYSSDVVMMQELLWKVRPDVIIETGVAHGGTAILYASILELIGKGQVVGIDIEIRQYNKIAIQGHPLSKRIQLIEGSSVSDEVLQQVERLVEGKQTVMVTFDSNHSYEHVKREIELYSKFVTPDSYMVVMDGAQAQVWDLPNGKAEWKTDNPLKAIEEFISENEDKWQEDPYYNRLKITSNPRGFLKRLRQDD